MINILIDTIFKMIIMFFTILLGDNSSFTTSHYQISGWIVVVTQSAVVRPVQFVVREKLMSQIVEEPFF